MLRHPSHSAPEGIWRPCCLAKHFGEPHCCPVSYPNEKGCPCAEASLDSDRDTALVLQPDGPGSSANFTDPNEGAPPLAAARSASAVKRPSSESATRMPPRIRLQPSDRQRQGQRMRPDFEANKTTFDTHRSLHRRKGSVLLTATRQGTCTSSRPSSRRTAATLRQGTLKSDTVLRVL